MSSIEQFTPSQLRRAAAIKDKIANLESELSGILGTPTPIAKVTTANPVKKSIK